MIKAIFLDLDNTLVPASHLHKDAFIKAVKEFTGIEISNNFHDNFLDGLPTKKKLRFISDIPVEKHESISSRKQELTIQLIEEKIHNDPSKVELLIKLKLSEYKVACVTNAIRKTAKLMLERTGIWPYFDLLISNEDVVKSKPNPEPYFKAMSYFDVPSCQCLAVEDNYNGIDSAKRAGIKVWEVSGPDEVIWSNIQKYLE